MKRFVPKTLRISGPISAYLTGSFLLALTSQLVAGKILSSGSIHARGLVQSYRRRRGGGLVHWTRLGRLLVLGHYAQRVSC
jgi:hypothetical protein